MMNELVKSSKNNRFFIDYNYYFVFDSYAGRDSAAASATGIKLSFTKEQKDYMSQAMAI